MLIPPFSSYTSRHVTYGSLDDPEQLPPKAEFFCKQRSIWMPEIPDIFHKQEVKQ